jgi:hypothetical protein
MPGTRVMLGQAVVLAQRVLAGLLDDVPGQAGINQQMRFTPSRVANVRSAAGGPPERDNRTGVVSEGLSRAFWTGSDQAAGAEPARCRRLPHHSSGPRCTERATLTNSRE